MACTSKERLERWKRKTAQRALVSSADATRFCSDERAARSARLAAQLWKGNDRSVTEERLAGVLAARKRRESL